MHGSLEVAMYLGLGGAVGFVLGYIVRSLREIKEGVDEVKSHDQKHEIAEEVTKRVKGEGGFVRIPYVQDVLMIFVITLVVYAAWSTQGVNNDLQQNYHDDKVARCEAGQLNRDVQRKTVDAVYNLAISVVSQPGKNDPPITKSELAKTNAYIDRVNEFRQNMYDQIKPSPECEPYVDDKNVDPPTTPQPHLTIKE
jgi:hypothetical protein